MLIVDVSSSTAERISRTILRACVERTILCGCVVRRARALIRIPRSSRAAPCILTSPSRLAPEQLPAILFISLVPHSVPSFRFFRRVMSRPWVRSVLVSRRDRCLGSPTRSDPVHDDSAKGASSARPSRKTRVSIPSRKRRRSRPIIVRRAAKARV